MKTKLHLLFFALLFSVGLQAQSVTVTSTLPATIETGDTMNFTADYTTDANSYNLIVRFFESDGIVRYGSAQSIKGLTASTTGTESLSINAPLVAGSYVAKVFIEGPAPGYAKTFAPDIAFTVTDKVFPIKSTYLFDTGADAEGWEVGTTGGGGTGPTASVASGSLTFGKGTTNYGITYIQQNTNKLDPNVHSYVHITYNKSGWSANNELGLDWIKSGTTRSSATGANVAILNNPNGFQTVSYNLGANTEWKDGTTLADATNFRIYYRESGSDTKGGPDLIVGSIIFSNTATPPNVFTAAVDNDFTNAANWSSGSAPGSTSAIVIPADKGVEAVNLTVDPTGSLTIESGGSLKVSGTLTGNLTYNVAIPDDEWHLLAVPVAGETYGGATTWIADNSIASGTTDSNNKGISTYSNGTPDGTTGNWRYYNTTGGTETTFTSGTGYSLKATAATTYTFDGTYPTFPINTTITQGVNNWNLVGNSTPAYIDVAAYVTANTASLAGSFKSVYLFNPSTGYTAITTGYIHPGQAFFVNAGVASGTVSTTYAMLSHQTGVVFQKSNTTSIDLSIKEGKTIRKTYLEYRNDGTLGLDPGKDIGKFNGVNIPLSIYTNLLKDNENIAFERQALPNSDFESMQIPVGIKAAAGKEITISATSLNLPENIKVYLEDRELNIFTDLTSEDYKITLNSDLDGVGRFFLRTSSSSVLSNDNITLSGINIYKTNNATLKIVGLQQGASNIKLFTILGKQIFNNSFEANGAKEISLPKLATGVYIVQLETAAGKLNKKIILE